MKVGRMQKATDIMIHRFEPSASPTYDDEGDEMLGSYFQLIGADGDPVSDMIGPYGQNWHAERAAMAALRSKSYL